MKNFWLKKEKENDKSIQPIEERWQHITDDEYWSFPICPKNTQAKILPGAQNLRKPLVCRPFPYL